MNTNCRGVWMLTQAALPFIPRGGRIIIVGSISGRTGGPKQVYRLYLSTAQKRQN